VTRLTRRKSQQGCHDPSAFRTMWSGDDQGLSDLRTILSFSSRSNSAFAAASFFASRRQKRAAMGCPVILMWCSTSDPTGGRTFDAQTTLANSSKNSFTHCGDSSGGASAAAATPARAAEGGEILLSTWVASAAAAAPARASEGGEILLSTWAASAEMVVEGESLLSRRPPTADSVEEAVLLIAPAGCACRGGGSGHRCKSLQRSGIHQVVRLAGLTNSWTPIMANCTSGCRNVHVKRRPWKDSSIRCSPQQGIPRQITGPPWSPAA
jgi:hypothetical protein